MAEDVYNAVKSSRCLQRTFNALSLQDFIMSGLIAACHRLKCLSLVPYYVAQMKRCVQKWAAVVTTFYIKYVRMVSNHDIKMVGSRINKFQHKIRG